MATSRNVIGLFLGAGASSEVGMPLVWELTEELKGWLTPEKLRELNDGWRSQGTGYPDEVIEDFISVLVIEEMHYESLLGYVETQAIRQSSSRHEYLGLYALLVEIVHHILRMRHTNNAALIERNVASLEGMAKLAQGDHPLWVFSLNHDMIVECVAAKFGVPIHSGFCGKPITFPRRDPVGTKIGELKAETLTEDDLKRGIAFPASGRTGVNLIKVHGALDIFSFRDGKDFAKLVPDAQTVRDIIDVLRLAEEELIFVDPARSHPFKTTNEITYADDEGVMQFLRRSLVAGTHKFDNRHSQVIPKGFLRQFESNINFVSTLICIGYGFGDLHINQVLRDWLERSSERRLEIASPSATIPPYLLHLRPQVAIHKEAGSDYLDRVAGIVRTRRELSQRRLGRWFYRHRKDPEEQQRFLTFMHERQNESFRELFVRMKARIDAGESGRLAESPLAAGVLEQEVQCENDVSFDALVEEFLSTEDS
jgi:hypothetical protein